MMTIIDMEELFPDYTLRANEPDSVNFAMDLPESLVSQYSAAKKAFMEIYTVLDKLVAAEMKRRTELRANRKDHDCIQI